MQSQDCSYQDKELTCQGFLAYGDNEKKPLVLIVHDWTGRNPFAIEKAKQLAQMGYVGFAVDMYGDGRIGQNNEEKMSLMQPLMQDRSLLLRRIKAAYDFAKTLSMVDEHKIAIIGFCFGGLCALDLARSGVDLKGVVSFHGLLKRNEHDPLRPIPAKVLACHGHNDPMVTPEQVLAFQTEMTECGADWQTHIYGNVSHAFTNPLANDTAHGLIYNALAAKRSDIAMRNFLQEVFE